MKPETNRRNPHSLRVQNCSVRIYPGRSSITPEEISGKDLGYIILRGVGTTFTIGFLPDGSVLPKPYYDPNENAVKLCMNWCQFEGVLTILATADSVQAYYFEDENGPWADVEGQFTPKSSRRKSKKPKSK